MISNSNHSKHDLKLNHSKILLLKQILKSIPPNIIYFKITIQINLIQSPIKSYKTCYSIQSLSKVSSHLTYLDPCLANTPKELQES